MANTTSSTLSQDQEKYLHAKLISRSLLRLQCGSVLESIALPEGTGSTGYFIRYERLYVPSTTLTEGSAPTAQALSTSQVTVTLDQWGGNVIVTDVAQLTAKHPVVDEAVKLLADQAQRVIDKEIQSVFLAGTNVQYGDGTVTSRPSMTTSLKMNDTVLNKARVTMVNNGAPPRGGPGGGVQLGQGGATEMGKGTSGLSSAQGQTFNNGQHYVAICGPEVLSDLRLASTSLGQFTPTAMYRDQSKLYDFEMGEWLGFRWIETNFIPRFTLLGSSTAAVASGNAFGTDTPTVTVAGTGGALKSATTFYWKVVRKDKLRGFAEQISVAHSTSSGGAGDDEKMTFSFAALTAGYNYDLYFDNEAAGGGSGLDSQMGLVQANIEVGDSVVVTTVATSTTQPPPAVCAAAGTGITINPVYIVAEDFGAWVHLQPLRVMITGDQATIGGNELNQLKSIGWKYMGKAVIKDQLRILRVECYSAYS